MSEYLHLSPKNPSPCDFQKKTPPPKIRCCSPFIIHPNFAAFGTTKNPPVRAAPVEDLSFAPVELPPEPQLDAQQRATKLRRRLGPPEFGGFGGGESGW